MSVTQPPLWSYFGAMIIKEKNSSPFQKGTIYQNGSLSTKGTILVPPLAPFLNMNTKKKKQLRPLKWHQNSSTRGAELRTSKQLPKGSYFGSLFSQCRHSIQRDFRHIRPLQLCQGLAKKTAKCKIQNEPDQHPLVRR